MASRSPVPHTHGASFQSDLGAMVLMLGVGLMMVATFVVGSLTMALVILQQVV